MPANHSSTAATASYQTPSTQGAMLLKYSVICTRKLGILGDDTNRIGTNDGCGGMKLFFTFARKTDAVSLYGHSATWL